YHGHLINYHQIGFYGVVSVFAEASEAFSGSAEELCYPGSGLYSRIQSWHNHRWTNTDELLDPPAEYAYTSSYGLHTGGSLTAWDSSQDDIYARYAEVMLFSQYLYSRWGDTTVYKRIIGSNPGRTDADSYTALTAGTGWSIDSVWKDFFISMIANSYENGYGFRMNEGYEPADYYNLENLYSLLSPVIFTGTEATITSGGFITVKPVNGVFVPPEDASPKLKYVGIGFNAVALEGIAFEPSETTVLTGGTERLKVVPTPAGANNFDIFFTSSDTSVAKAEASGRYVRISGIAPGTAVITASAVDRGTGETYTAAAAVTVRNGHTYVRYEPTDTVETGVEYLIGYQDAEGVYLIMNYNPNMLSPGTNYYFKDNAIFYGYGVLAETDAHGNIIGVDTAAYPDAQTENVTWFFIENGDYYKIRSGYNQNYYLRVYDLSSGYPDLYPNGGTAGATNWSWDAEAHHLTYTTSTHTKYASFIKSVDTHQNFFHAPTSADESSHISLYKKTVGVEYDETLFYTVTFVDWNDEILSVQQVEEGHAAVAPADPVREGWNFIGWDVDFSHVTSDLTVTAQYEQALSVTLLGDIDLNGAVNAVDALLALRHAMHMIELEGQGLTNGDMNGDGIVNATDAVLIMRLVLNVQ
ncbi:MAG: Ig-like domain-containing protein, partial [Clostridia bacterium]|nr:Ig-like domain-containing protein [Clostridia bacterium]